jgi:hypothetical protein
MLEDGERDSKQRAHSSELSEIKRVHERKIRSLIEANSQLKAQCTQLKREGQDNYRVKMIKNQKAHIRELETGGEALRKVSVRSITTG